jgi:hypothetical protein
VIFLQKLICTHVFLDGEPDLERLAKLWLTLAEGRL